MHRVVLQQIRERGRVGEIVDGDEFDVGIALERGADTLRPMRPKPLTPTLTIGPPETGS